MRHRPQRILLAVLLAAVALAPRPALAGQSAVPDGSGGFFVAWDEVRNVSDVVSTSEILVQRYTALGTPAPGWPAYGLHVTDSPPSQEGPAMVSDGAGGVIVVWLDHTGGIAMPRAQHVSALGQHLWASAGTALSEGDSLRGAPMAVSDGAGGAFVAWSDNTQLISGLGVVVQHVESNGAISSGWPAAGLLIKQDDQNPDLHALFSDGAGGAIVAWFENSGWFAQRLSATGSRLWSPPSGAELGLFPDWGLAGDGAGGLLAASVQLGPSSDYEVRAQRFDGAGAPAWGPTGVVVHSASTSLDRAVVAPDGSGGAIVAWADGATGASFAQRMDASGVLAPGWPAGGAQIFDSGEPGTIVGDGSGGAFFARVFFFGTGTIKSQHLKNDGTLPAGWPASGVVVTSGPGGFTSLGTSAISDGTGGEIVYWRESRSGLRGFELFAQRLDASGAAQWATGGIAIASEANCQRAPAIAGDGAGGAIAFWMDKRSGGWDIFGKRVNGAGQPLGASAAVSAAADDQFGVQAADDGAGGGCAAWLDLRNGVVGVEAQRLPSSGTPAWTPDGVDLVEGFGALVPFGVAGDGAGGAIVAWPQPWSSEVRAQRLDATGAALWGAGGALVSFGSTLSANWIDAISDGAGGVIVVWWGFGLDPETASFVYGLHAQRLNSAGARLWGNDGVLLAPSDGAIFRNRVTGDGSGGVYLAWEEVVLPFRSGAIRVQHRDAAGQLAAGWPAGGVVVASLTSSKLLAAISPDGAGGVVVGWGEARGGGSWAAYVQRVAADATVKWTAEGVRLTTNTGDQLLSGIVPDGGGGAIGVWMDGAGTTWDVRAQRVNDVGATQWSPAGLAVCTAAGNQYAPAMVTDGAGGAVVAWQDDRAFPVDQIFMARIGAGGTLLWPLDGVVPVMASVVSAEARGGVAHLEWHVASATHARIERSDDGVAWSTRATLDADGQGRIRFDDADVRPAHRYGWRLAIPAEGGVTRVGEAWLDMPSRESFALRGTYPNPSSHALSIAFSLPGAAAARLEVMDISGRRVWSRDVGALGAGPHEVPLPELRAGVYLVRLTQGSRSATTRFERVK
jgi:hypothetical protein